MSDLTKIATVVKVAVKTGKVLAKDKDVVKLVCGKYSDGSVRNLTDAIQGEYLSPKQKKKILLLSKIYVENRLILILSP